MYFCFMRILKIVFDFYLNSSIHVALSVYALTWITLRTFEISYDENILYFNFYATITGYNFVKYFGLAKFHHRSLANWLKAIQVFSFFCFLALGYYAFKLETKTLLWVGSFGLLTFFYAIPFLPRHFFLDKEKNLRSITDIRIIYKCINYSKFDNININKSYYNNKNINNYHSYIPKNTLIIL